MRQLPVIVLLILILCTCGRGGSTDQDVTDNGDPGGSSDPVDPPDAAGDWYQPPVSVTWQWQLSGEVNTTYAVAIYDIDLFDTSQDQIQGLQAQGRRVICYFSAGSYEEWRSDADQFKAADLGQNLDGWPGERWLDIRSADVEALMKARLDLAVQKGCDGVEPDNMDGYTNVSGFDFTAADQLVYNRMLASAAHARGLAIGLKNDLDQIIDLVDEFDFAVNEQCFEYDECDLLDPFIDQGKAVLQAEYRQTYVDDTGARDALCRDARGKHFSTLILPLLLDDEFRYSCN